MAKLKIKGRDLKKIGFMQGRVIGITLNIVHHHFKKKSKVEVLKMLQEVLKNPKKFKEDAYLSPIAEELFEAPKLIKGEIAFKSHSIEYVTYGATEIEDGATNQMDIAMKLPITTKGALMADAHQGYGLPIGGVLATENAIIPYGVGMDIGCRMCMTLYDLKPNLLKTESEKLKSILEKNTRFGISEFDKPMADAILSRSEFKEIPLVKSLKQKAYKQLGSSGSGNHFVEFGITTLSDPNNEWNLPVGDYVAVLSHSGSRGMGAKIAQHYTKLAMEKCLLPKEAKHLAWLDLDKEEGQEYWLAMNLAGDYASACHNQIHIRIAKALGENPLAKIENHHNFAWKEKLENGKEVIVHRKGATPAGKGVLGVIPGSMTAPGFIVRGKGNATAINSAAHGAGRQMSRTQAKKTFSQTSLKKILKDNGVELIGGGLDESPGAYKDIHKVMAAQRDLVEVVGTFLPKIVRMDK